MKKLAFFLVALSLTLGAFGQAKITLVHNKVEIDKAMKAYAADWGKANNVQVTIITSAIRMSPFVVELLDDPHVTVIGSGDQPIEICPQCGKGTMIRRSGKRGPFLGCSSFPACTHTRDL